MYWLVKVSHGKDRSIKVIYPTNSYITDKDKFMEEYGDMLSKVWGHKLEKVKEISEEQFNDMKIMCGDRTPLFRALDILRTDYNDRHGGFVRTVYRFLT